MKCKIVKYEKYKIITYRIIILHSIVFYYITYCIHIIYKKSKYLFLFIFTIRRILFVATSFIARNFYLLHFNNFYYKNF